MDQVDPTYRSSILWITHPLKLRLPHPKRQLHPDAQGLSNFLSSYEGHVLITVGFQPGCYPVDLIRIQDPRT